MATIKVVNNYEINIDGNKDHCAREFTKIYVNPKTQEETPQYRNVGHYGSVEGALKGIYKDMCIQKANKKDFVSVKEWIDIVEENEIIFENLFKKYKVN